MSIWGWLRRGALLVLVLTALFSAFHFWRSTLVRDQGGEAIVAFEKRLEPAREAIPFQRGVIGYLGEWDVPGIGTEFRDQQVEFLLAQYTLAPLILQRGAQAEWTVAVLGPPALQAWQKTHPGEFEIIPLGRGVYILHRGGNQ